MFSTISTVVGFICLVSPTFGGTWTQNGKFDYFLLDVGINTKSGAYSAALANGIGSLILKSSDLGVSWSQLAERDGFMTIGCGSNSNDSAIITGIMGKGIYTVDGGNTFHDSVGFIPGVQAVAKSRVDKQYGAPGGAGMSVSSDYGATWTHHKASDINATRYGTLPSENTWYISAGIWEEPTTQFPMPLFEEEHGNDNSQIMKIKKISSKIKFYYNEKNNFIKTNLQMMGYDNNKNGNNNGNRKWKNSANSENTPKNEAKLNRLQRKLLQEDDGIWGEIWKTTDGGSTWTLSYSNSGSFYFNGIDCCDENTCYAVAEGDAEAGSTSPGARIFGTTDGGNTWTQLYYDNNDASSLMAVHCISDQEVWAAGGTIAQKDFNGIFLHSSDGGTNWDTTTVNDPVLFMDMTNDGMYGIATGLTKMSLGVSYGFE